MAEETSTNESTGKNTAFIPLTPNQEVIWVETKLYPGTPIYCMGGYLLIEGEVLPRVLRQAVNVVIDKNDALRIKIHEIDGNPYQEFLTGFPYDLEYIDFSTEKEPRQTGVEWMESARTYMFTISNFTMWSSTVGEPLFIVNLSPKPITTL
ncbi:MAG: hypothetical protein GY757_45325 [bacterium]|nr:hypothetical protein [bacterium]